MRKKYKICLIIIGILLILTVAVGVLKLFKHENKVVNTNSTNIISNISEYGYSLDDRDTEYMKEVFEELKEILENAEVDYEAYAKTLAKLFVIDFYTLNNKINKYDVGGLEYIYSEALTSFKNKAMDTIYSDIIDNTYKDRIQDLPEITNVEVLQVSTTQIELNETEVEAYQVTMKYTYKEDLGYDTEGTIYLVKNINKLEVVLYNPVIEDTTDNSNE